MTGGLVKPARELRVFWFQVTPAGDVTAWVRDGARFGFDETAIIMN